MASYVKTILKNIVDNIGCTEYGPAASFKDIVKAIVNNTSEVLSIAAPTQIEGIPELVSVSVPRRLGETIGYSLFEELPKNEQGEIIKAAHSIYHAYLTLTDNLW